MKNLIGNINRAFESRIRLGIMSMLMVDDWVEFKTLKMMLEVTDGNLASHISALEKLKYIEVQKQFVGKKPKTTYSATFSGRRAFKDHINALEQLLKHGGK